jgi:hypothetical protein
MATQTTPKRRMRGEEGQVGVTHRVYGFPSPVRSGPRSSGCSRHSRTSPSAHSTEWASSRDRDRISRCRSPHRKQDQRHQADEGALTRRRPTATMRGWRSRRRLPASRRSMALVATPTIGAVPSTSLRSGGRTRSRLRRSPRPRTRRRTPRSTTARSASRDSVPRAGWLRSRNQCLGVAEDLQRSDSSTMVVVVGEFPTLMGAVLELQQPAEASAVFGLARLRQGDWVANDGEQERSILPVPGWVVSQRDRRRGGFGNKGAEETRNPFREASRPVAASLLAETAHRR